MPELPPPALVALLERLGLATAAQVGGVAWRVRRLASDLPRFESVWIDALAQARVLTPFQAAELNAGRGELLRVGPYLLCQRLDWPEYAAAYRARRVDSPQHVRLLVAENDGPRADEILRRFEHLATVAAQYRSDHVAPVTAAGRDGNRLWAASAWVEGRSAAEWMVHHGRLPGDVVLEIARAMSAALVAFDEVGLCHGDISDSALLLTDDGRTVLLQPGVRGILRPEEGHTHADLRPHSYDYLAAERVVDGTPPTAASDMYACGCLWWHLLCGRPPLSGGDSLAKLRAVQAGQVADVRRFAPEVPTALGAALSACVQKEPRQRPESLVRLAAMLGPPTRSGAVALARCLTESGRRTTRWAVSLRVVRRSSLTPLWLAGAAVCLVAVAAVLWPMLNGRGSGAGGRGPGGLARSTSHNVGDGEIAGGQRPPSPAGVRVRTAPTRLSDQPAPAGVACRLTSAVEESASSTVPYSPSNVHSPSQVPRPLSPESHPTSLIPPPSSVARPPTSDLILAGGPVDGQTLQFHAGQRVRGEQGKRPLVLVPRGGLPVEADDVRFENIDFLWKHAAAGESQGPPDAVVQLRCARGEFRGCTFQAQSSPRMPAAIRWTYPAESQAAALQLPSGKLRLDNCLLRQVEAGVDCCTIGAMCAELNNTLVLGKGPLLRLDHCPKPDEPLRISLSQVTLRGTGPLVECRYEQSEQPRGEISIEADQCVFAPAGGAPLLLFAAPTTAAGVPATTAGPHPLPLSQRERRDLAPPEQLLSNLRWTGQGSLITPATAFAAWQPFERSRQTLDDSSVSIAGLVRSDVGFAGQSPSTAADSRIIRWQAPLQSPDPPGVNPQFLPNAESR